MTESLNGKGVTSIYPVTVVSAHPHQRSPPLKCTLIDRYLGGGFKHFLFSPLFREDFQSD